LDQDISGLKYVSTGELIRSCWRGEIEIFDPKTGKALPPFRVNDDDDKVDAIALFQEGTRLAVLCDDSVSVWSWPERKPLLQFKAGGWQSRIAVSPDGKTIAVSEDEKDVQLFDARNGKRRGGIKSKGGKHLVFTPDGEHLIISHDGPDEISIWNVKDTKQVCRFSTKDCTFVLDVSPDGEYLGAATGRGAFVWRLLPLLASK
jgi:WD40 repeat protein